MDPAHDPECLGHVGEQRRFRLPASPVKQFLGDMLACAMTVEPDTATVTFHRQIVMNAAMAVIGKMPAGFIDFLVFGKLIRLVECEGYTTQRCAIGTIWSEKAVVHASLR